jgi:hypothetical protein
MTVAVMKCKIGKLFDELEMAREYSRRLNFAAVAATRSSMPFTRALRRNG